MLCVHPELTESFLEEFHEGICGSHTGGRSLAHRAITQGYWWPNMQKEALEYVRKRLWNTSENVISANSLRRAYTNQGESLIRYLAHGRLLNGVRHYGTISQSSGKQEISPRWHRLFYEVG